jgi:hypothetical protein
MPVSEQVRRKNVERNSNLLFRHCCWSRFSIRRGKFPSTTFDLSLPNFLLKNDQLNGNPASWLAGMPDYKTFAPKNLTIFDQMFIPKSMSISLI